QTRQGTLAQPEGQQAPHLPMCPPPAHARHHRHRCTPMSRQWAILAQTAPSQTKTSHRKATAGTCRSSTMRGVSQRVRRTKGKLTCRSNWYTRLSPRRAPASRPSTPCPSSAISAISATSLMDDMSSNIRNPDEWAYSWPLADRFLTVDPEHRNMDRILPAQPPPPVISPELS